MTPRRFVSAPFPFLVLPMLDHVLRRGSRRVESRRPKGRVVRPGTTFVYFSPGVMLEVLYLGRPGTTLRASVRPSGLRVWAMTASSYDEVTAVKKKQPPKNTSGVKHLAAIESTIFAKCHGVVKHCSITQYEDGEPRKPGWITIKTLGSAWQVEAKDPDSCLSLRVLENSLDEALELLNLLLESEEAPWELDTWLQQQAARNRKK